METLRPDFSKRAFFEGLRDGVPIGLGYFAVAFSLGITARNAGLNSVQSFIMSFLCNASAGEYAGITVIAARASYIEMILITLIANIRYILMSLALSQRMAPGTPLLHRLGVAFDVTDEIFAVTISRSGFVNPFHSYGMMLVATPCWAVGTAIGNLAGELLPARLVSALSVALYGMFLAVIIPPARKSRIIAGLIAVCFAASYAASRLPWISGLSAGTRTIILTMVIASAAAILFPRKEQEADA